MRYALVLAAAVLVLAAAPTAASHQPSAGAPDVGDRLFPGLGNGGYDALHYHLDLRYFLRAWLYGTTTPPMPGHPDWTVDPVGAPAAALAPAGLRPSRFVRR